jgi:phosphopantothenoylcysteine decarboxylase/phosphopantothenate--cysteine ligase
MAKPEQIIEHLQQFFTRSGELTGKRILVTAGPTHESLDPVRFISNHSSGKMGIAIAETLEERGASVQLILGPATASTRIRDVIHVTTADEMYTAVMENLSTFHIIIMAAAVADFKAVSPVHDKIKKGEENFLMVKLVKTRDILKEAGVKKEAHQLLVGFALETNNEKENALKKMSEKKLDLIVLNSLNDEQAGFGKDTNKITIFDNRGNEYPFQAKTKKQVANDIITTIIQYQNA